MTGNDGWVGPEKLVDIDYLGKLRFDMEVEFMRLNMNRPYLEVVGKAYCDGDEAYTLVLNYPVNKIATGKAWHLEGTDLQLQLLFPMSLLDNDPERLKYVQQVAKTVAHGLQQQETGSEQA